MVESLVHVLLAGLSAGMFIWLVASGLTLIFGVLRVLNFAHGSFYMLGAYLCYTCLRFLGVNFWLGVIVGPLGVCAVGFLVERYLLRRVYDLELPYQLLLTFSLVLIFDELVKIIWGAGSIGSPVVPGLSGSVQIAGRNFSIYNLFIMGFGPLVALGLWALLEKSWWGRIIRASASDREMAAAIGVRVPTMYTGVFVLGAWLSALGGALAVPYVGAAYHGNGRGDHHQRIRGGGHRWPGQPERGFSRSALHRSAELFRNQIHTHTRHVSHLHTHGRGAPLASPGIFFRG